MDDSNVPFFSSIDPDVPITKLDSLCMACYGQGKTHLMCTHIPYFRDVILTSFLCDSCGYKNAGYQSGTIQDRGLCFTFQLTKPQDISRSLALSEYATIKIPDVDFEVPPTSKKAVISTVEGILRRVIDDLNINQAERKDSNPELAEKLDEFINKLESLILLESSFKIIIDDPSGNSCIEEINYPNVDPQVLKEYYVRSEQQNKEMGLNVNNTIEEEEESNEDTLLNDDDDDGDDNGLSQLNDESEKNPSKQLDLTNEVQVFNTTCDQCQKPSQTKMKLTTIPYFSDVVIMATDCSHCGHRSNEVKSGGGINDKGKRISLSITNVSIDMSRDVLKSDTCSIEIPQLDLCVGAGILVSKFTTVEGLLRDIKEDMKNNPFLMGDAINYDRRSKMNLLLNNFEKIINGELAVCLILDDPAGNSYLQNPNAPQLDEHLTIEEYERTFDQNEELGLNDMKTENYTDT